MVILINNKSKLDIKTPAQVTNIACAGLRMNDEIITVIVTGCMFGIAERNILSTTDKAISIAINI